MDCWFVVGVLSGVMATLVAAGAWGAIQVHYRVWRYHHRQARVRAYADPIEGQVRHFPGPIKGHSPCPEALGKQEG